MNLVLSFLSVLSLVSTSEKQKNISTQLEIHIEYEDSIKLGNLVRFELYKGDTINRLNEKGYPTGLWFKFPDSTSEFTFQYYRTGETGNFSDNLWTKSFYPSGVLRSHWVRDTMCFYYENGNLASRDITKGYESGVTEYFYTSGKRERTCFSSLKWSQVNGKNISEIAPSKDSCHCWLESGKRLNTCH